MMTNTVRFKYKGPQYKGLSTRNAGNCISQTKFFNPVQGTFDQNHRKLFGPLYLSQTVFPLELSLNELTIQS